MDRFERMPNGRGPRGMEEILASTAATRSRGPLPAVAVRTAAVASRPRMATVALLLGRLGRHQLAARKRWCRRASPSPEPGSSAPSAKESRQSPGGLWRIAAADKRCPRRSAKAQPPPSQLQLAEGAADAAASAAPRARERATRLSRGMGGEAIARRLRKPTQQRRQAYGTSRPRARLPRTTQPRRGRPEELHFEDGSSWAVLLSSGMLHEKGKSRWPRLAAFTRLRRLHLAPAKRRAASAPWRAMGRGRQGGQDDLENTVIRRSGHLDVERWRAGLDSRFR